MAGFLRMFLSSDQPSNGKDDEGYSMEYSFAVEYVGPAIHYAIPQVVPVDIDRVPTASAVASAAQFNCYSLPISQPIVKKSKREKTISGSKVEVSSGSIAPEDYYFSNCDENTTSLGFSDGSDTCVAPKAFDEKPEKVSRGWKKKEEEEEFNLPEDGDDKIRFQAGLNLTSYGSAKSSLSSSSVISSPKEGEIEIICEWLQPRHVKGPSVTFLDPETTETVSDEKDSQSEAESYQWKPKARILRTGKKGSCYRCLKGNKFTEKEVCIVCRARYCCKCMLKAMGSMPEGRKCVVCIGYRIDESKRDSLGKCSRMLKRMLTEFQVREIMASEIESEANQIASTLVIVNEVPLTHAELIALRSCSNPPKNLTPGCYWYDKTAGFWGKDGREPHQIISPRLDVGGCIRGNASNGKTDVWINERVITKKELFMLKVAGVPCVGRPHYWVSADGSYSEEGMNHKKGKIWAKTKTKIFCAALSLPTPPESANFDDEEVKNVIPELTEQKMLWKILLVGHDKSGTSTIFKQVMLLYNVPFSEEERQNIKYMIQRNLYGYLGILLEGRQRFEEETLINKRKRDLICQSGPSGNREQINDRSMYCISPKLKAFSDWLLNIMVSGNLESIFQAATCIYAPLVEELWKDAAIQATYDRKNELEMLPRVATYFLDRAVEISRTDYEPSDNDILYAEGISSYNSLSCTEFSFPKRPQDSLLEDTPYSHDPSMRYQLIRVHSSSLGENCKWVEMFEDVDIILFSVALTDYEEFSEDHNGVVRNKMVLAKQLFERIVTHPRLCKKNFLLILNKFDLFDEETNRVPLNRCEWFQDFNPVIALNTGSSSSSTRTNPSSLRACQYIAAKFREVFNSCGKNNKLFVSIVTGLEQESVDEALRYAREVMKWHKEELSLISEVSSTSVEEATSTT